MSLHFKLVPCQYREYEYGWFFWSSDFQDTSMPTMFFQKVFYRYFVAFQAYLTFIYYHVLLFFII